MELKLQIDGQTVSVREGATLMEAINKVGAYVPHFCYHEKLSIAANCRMCMVHVEKSPKALPACATPVIDGMVVFTNSEVAKTAQRSVMEFLLINHPLDCPICDQGGECQLQDLAVGYGVSRSRYQEEKRVVFEKNLGPLISTDMTRCIHCTRCVRFGREVAGIMELGMIGRGEHAEIMPFVERTVDSELSGNMIDVCPVGALTSKPFRYTARPWELKHHETIATHDSWGSHVSAQIKQHSIKRVTPSCAPEVKECWISDRDRFSYEGLNSAERVLTPMMNERNGQKMQETPWKTAFERLAAELRQVINQHGADKVGFFVSPRSTYEEAFLLQRIARRLGCQNIDSRLLQRDFSGADISGLGMAFADINTLRTALFVGAEPSRELPLLAAHLRQKQMRKTYLSLSPVDISGQIPVQQQIITAPEKLAKLMRHLFTALGGIAPSTSSMPLLDDALTDGTDTTIKAMAKSLQQAGKNGVIWLGDIARESMHYGTIADMAMAISDLTGCRVGALDDGANGVGMRLAGALPNADGYRCHTAAMLRADLRAVVLFRCESTDFAEQGLVRQLLDNAELVCRFTPFAEESKAFVKIILPVADFGETDGTYINGQGSHEHFAAATHPPGQTRPAWKALRYLGELLAIPEFDFSEIDAVHTMNTNTVSDSLLPTQPSLPPTDNDANNDAKNNTDDDAASDVAGEFSRCGGMPLYGGDMLVRRATALQKTNQGMAATQAQMHPDDMAMLGVTDKDMIIISDGTATWQTTVCVNKTLAVKVIRFRTPNIMRDTGLSVQKVAGE